eukprot:TRINITY_DN15243_c0_g5_i1.p1 TRINITY_DN15243_c0_g5~~TRINITY_DN15243_c0_g5_i1.p1  ORF type:complete len:351 (+),score=86.75 TRINITY_DN15243_c0_g5_i1:77-1054(+)
MAADGGWGAGGTTAAGHRIRDLAARIRGGRPNGSAASEAVSPAADSLAEAAAQLAQTPAVLQEPPQGRSGCGECELRLAALHALRRDFRAAAADPRRTSQCFCEPSFAEQQSRTALRAAAAARGDAAAALAAGLRTLSNGRQAAPASLGSADALGEAVAMSAEARDPLVMACLDAQLAELGRLREDLTVARLLRSVGPFNPSSAKSQHLLALVHAARVENERLCGMLQTAEALSPAPAAGESGGGTPSPQDPAAASSAAAEQWHAALRARLQRSRCPRRVLRRRGGGKRSARGTPTPPLAGAEAAGAAAEAEAPAEAAAEDDAAA